ncbi:MAG: CapA family protein [Candidatus Neomarinimicrobiota bacterium]
MGLVILGDIMLGRYQAPLIEKYGISKILSGLKKTIGKRKIIANLECPLINIKNIKNYSNSFSNLFGNEIIAKELFDNGFEALSLANNHIFDFGTDGLVNTQKTLKKNSIKYFGAGLNKSASIKPAIIELDNYLVGFLGFSFSNPSNQKKPGVAFLYDSTVDYAIKKVKNEVDFLIVMPHTGIELYKYPLKRDQKIYKKMVELGADLVVGSQSHVIQAMESYLNKYIYYGIGDLLFDHFHENIKSDFSSEISHSKKFSIKPNFSLTRLSLLIQIDIIEGELVVHHHPVLNKDGYNPIVLSSMEKEVWMKQFASTNYNLKHSLRIDKERKSIQKKLMRDLNNRGVL